jgi:hypothetical protein
VRRAFDARRRAHGVCGWRGSGVSVWACFRTVRQRRRRVKRNRAGAVGQFGFD